MTHPEGYSEIQLSRRARNLKYLLDAVKDDKQLIEFIYAAYDKGFEDAQNETRNSILLDYD